MPSSQASHSSFELTQEWRHSQANHRIGSRSKGTVGCWLPDCTNPHGSRQRISGRAGPTGVLARQRGHAIMPAIVTRRIARVWAAKARVSSPHLYKGRRIRYVVTSNVRQLTPSRSPLLSRSRPIIAVVFWSVLYDLCSPQWPGLTPIPQQRTKPRYFVASIRMACIV